jgi:TFIIF-interacting CTD phosphatase-like protein
MIFTASVKDYADAILNHIDPENTLIHHRFYRDSCVKTEIEGNTVYIKDLSVF